MYIAKDVYCSPKLSKLLLHNKLNFIQHCHCFYNQFDGDNASLKCLTEYMHSKARRLYYQAPTHQMVLKYLREEKDLCIEVYSTAAGYRYQINKAFNIEKPHFSGGTGIYDSGYSGPNDGGAWDYYEDCIEAAIEYCITKIISKL